MLLRAIGHVGFDLHNMNSNTSSFEQVEVRTQFHVVLLRGADARSVRHSYGDHPCHVTLRISEVIAEEDFLKDGGTTSLQRSR